MIINIVSLKSTVMQHANTRHFFLKYALLNKCGSLALVDTLLVFLGHTNP